jgi:primary-amine oxidase
MSKPGMFMLVLRTALLSVLLYSCRQAPQAPVVKAEIFDPVYTHPLDELDSTEIKLVKQVLKEKKIFTKGHLFSFIKLQEPPKAEILAYQPGQPFRREALASIYNPEKNVLTEIKLDLKTKQVIAVDTMENMQPVGLFTMESDSVTLSKVLKGSPEWVAALKDRGVVIDSVTYWGNPAADMGLASKGHRELIVTAIYKNKKMNNLGVRGLYAYVDLTDKKILKILDQGKNFTGPLNINYFKQDSAVATIEKLNPVQTEQPAGVNYKIKGHEITWNNWKFRYGISGREGLIIYQVSYNDKGKWRPVMYRGSMPEMVVNYGSPDVMMASNNYFDVGVYRLAQTKARPMTPGADAPTNAHYLSTVMHDDTGKVIPFERAAAVYEEFSGPLWRHDTKGVPSTNLAIKYFTTIGNYDYAFKWVFKEDGVIEIVNELNGIVHIHGVNRTSDAAGMGEGDDNFEGSYYGTLVNDHTEAVNHQHFFVYRLDLDVDGTTNSVAEMNTMAVPDGPHNPYKNTMVTKMTHFGKEMEAQRSANVASNRNWMVMNDRVMDKWGHHSSYMLMPGAGVKPFVNEGSSLLNRAGFLKNHVWITQLDEKEIYPAGDYPASNLVKAGLPSWTAKNRDIGHKDVVLWYVTGITHIVRPEEWPIMTPHFVRFSLMPNGFFSQNPTVKMPPLKTEPVAFSENISLETAVALNKIPVCITPGQKSN